MGAEAEGAAGGPVLRSVAPLGGEPEDGVGAVTVDGA